MNVTMPWLVGSQTYLQRHCMKLLFDLFCQQYQKNKILRYTLGKVKYVWGARRCEVL